MAILAPSILSADLSNLSQQIRLVEMAGAEWIHCDIMDGHFVPNITFGPVVVKAAKNCTKLPLDVHLMIENPDKYLEEFANAGANSISVHYETVNHLNRTINKIKQLGCKAGVVLNPATPVSNLEYIAEYMDFVLLMSVNPGFGGQKFIDNTIRKIKDTVNLRQKLGASFLIEIDGGIDKSNAKMLKDIGVDIFVAGSAIFHSDNILAAATELIKMIK